MLALSLQDQKSREWLSLMRLAACLRVICFKQVGRLLVHWDIIIRRSGLPTRFLLLYNEFGVWYCTRRDVRRWDWRNLREKKMKKLMV